MSNINYITFDELMASVESDFATFTANGLINRGNYIKVVRKVNHDIGLKIFQQKEVMLKFENYRADLPDDFLYLQMALGCSEKSYYTGPAIHGTHTEEHNEPVVCTSDMKPCLMSSPCGTTYWVTQKFTNGRVIKHDYLFPLSISKKSYKHCADTCVNNHWHKYSDNLQIEGDCITASFREGLVYFNYLADMVDAEGNVLVMDHPKLTPYYEYAIKKSIMENVMIDGDDQVERKWGMMKNELREARIEALNFADTIEYDEIQEVY